MSAATPQDQILGIVNNHWQSCCVGAAAQLELADLLADGPLHVSTITGTVCSQMSNARGNYQSECSTALFVGSVGSYPIAGR
jgi:hypothetical protein